MNQLVIFTFVSLCVLSVYCEFGEDEAGQMMEKRKSAYMRFGRSSPSFEEMDDSEIQNMQKRKSAYMRFGKRSGPAVEAESEPEFEPEQEVQKRKSAYMRFGKRKSAYMRFGKRSAADFDDSSVGVNMEKRKSAYMRFGKK